MCTIMRLSIAGMSGEEQADFMKSFIITAYKKRYFIVQM